MGVHSLSFFLKKERKKRDIFSEASMTMGRRVTSVVLSVATIAGIAAAQDPSGGWLSYAVFKAGPTDIITRLSATMVAPAAPADAGGQPAFWFGVQVGGAPARVERGCVGA